jgi:hypothetical protein
MDRSAQLDSCPNKASSGWSDIPLSMREILDAEVGWSCFGKPGRKRVERSWLVELVSVWKSSKSLLGPCAMGHVEREQHQAPIGPEAGSNLWTSNEA